MVKRIAENFDPNLFDPPVLWKDPESGELVMVSGHTRLEGLKAAGIEEAPFRILPPGTTQEQAVEISEAGNLQRVEHNDWENAQVIRRRIEKGDSKAQIQRDLPGLGSANKVADLERLAYLNPGGLFKESWDAQGFPKIKQMGYFTGGMRKRFDWLTNQHEKDIFAYLYHDGAVHNPDIGVPQEVILNLLEVMEKKTADARSPRLALRAGSVETGRLTRPDMAEALVELDGLRKDTHALTQALQSAETREAQNAIKTELAIIADRIFTIEKGLDTIEQTQTSMFEGRARSESRPTYNLFTGDPEKAKTEAEMQSIADRKELRDQHDRDLEHIREQVAAGKMPETRAQVARIKARRKWLRSIEDQGQKNLFDADAGEPSAQGGLFEGRAASKEDRGLFHSEPKGAPAKRVMTIERIIRNLEKDLDVPIRGRATHPTGKRAGWYQTRDKLIRVVDYGDLPTHFHEAGHHMERLLFGRGVKMDVSGRRHFAKYKSELTPLDYDQNPKTGRRTREGFAEYIRILISDVMDPAKAAPEFHKYFVGEVLPKNPTVANAIERARVDYQQYREQGAEARVLSQIDSGESFTDKVGQVVTAPKEAVESGINWLRKKFVDDIAPIDIAIKRAGVDRSTLRPSEDPVEVARSVKLKSHSMARQMVVEGTFDIGLNKTGPGLEQVMEPIRNDDQQTFISYAYSRKALDLLDVPRRRAEAGFEGINKPIDAGIDPSDAKYIVDKYDNPTWRAVSDGITEWSNKVLEYLVEAGGLSPELHEVLQATHWVYLPLMRSIAGKPPAGGGGRGLANQSSPVRKIKGSGRPIVNPIESLIRMVERIVATANKIRVVRSIIQIQKDYPGVKPMLVKVPQPLKAVTVQMDDIIKRLMAIGDDFDLGDGAIGELLTVFTSGGIYKGNDRIVALWKDGETNLYEIIDDDIYEAMIGLDQSVLHPMFEFALALPTRMIRLGAVALNPAFSYIRNLFRDAMLFAVTSTHTSFGPFSALSGSIKTVAHDIGLDETEEGHKFKRAGVQQTTFIGQDRQATKGLETRIERGKTVYYVTNPLESLRALLNVTEKGTRFAEYKAALKKGEELYGAGTEDAAVYASNAAQDVTVNFSRMGSYGRILNQMVPFWNPAIQGPAKIYRSMKNNPKSTFLKFMLWIGSTSAGLWALNHDRKEYKELTADERARFWFMFLDIDENGDAQTIIKLSKPFEIGTIATAFEAYLDDYYNDDPALFKDVMDAAMRPVVQPVDPRQLPRNIGLLGPMIDLWTNRDFADRPIVPERDLRKRPQDQYSQYNSKFFRYLGAKWGISPAKMQHLVDAYTGGLTGRVTRTYDNTLELLENGGENLTKSDIPVIGTLFKRTIGKPGRSIERFYNEIEVLRQEKASGVLADDKQGRLRIMNRKARAMSRQWKALRVATTKAEIEAIYRKMIKILATIVGGEHATE